MGIHRDSLCGVTGLGDINTKAHLKPEYMLTRWLLTLFSCRERGGDTNKYSGYKANGTESASEKVSH